MKANERPDRALPRRTTISSAAALRRRGVVGAWARSDGDRTVPRAPLTACQSGDGGFRFLTRVRNVPCSAFTGERNGGEKPHTQRLREQTDWCSGGSRTGIWNRHLMFVPSGLMLVVLAWSST